MADASKTLDILIRMRADVQDAIKGLGQTKTAVDGIGTGAGAATKPLGGLIDMFKQLAGPVLAFFSVRGLTSFFEGSVLEFARAESSSVKLRSEIRLLGADYTRVLPAINAVKTDLAQYGIAGSQVDAAMAGLLVRNFSIAQSLDAVRAAAKLSKIENVSLEESLNDIVNATLGTLRPNSLLGQILSSVREKIQQASTTGEKFKIVFSQLGKLDPAFADQMDTAATKIETLSAAWTQLKENVGGTEWGKGAIELLGILADELKGFNDETERNARLKAGTGTANDQFEQSNSQLALLLAKRRQLTASFFERINPFSDIATPSAADDAKVRKLLGLGVFDRVTTENLDAAITSERNKLKTAVTDINAEKVTANKELSGQQTRQQATDQDNLAAQTNAFLQQQSAKELASRADLAAVIDAQDAAIREKRFQAELAGLGDDLQQRLALTRKFYADELKAAQESAVRLQADRQKAIDAEAAQLTTLSTKPVTAEHIKEVAQAAAAGTADISRFNNELAIPEAKRVEFETRFNALVAQFAKVHEAATKLEGLEIDIPVKVKVATDDEIKKAITETEQKLSRALQDIQALKVSGSISEGVAVTRAAAARGTAETELQVPLQAREAEKSQLDALAALSPEQAARRKELIRDIETIKAELDGLKPTLESQIHDSNDFFEGVALGAQKAKRDMQSFGDIGAQVVDTFEHGLAGAGAGLFDNLTQGAKNFGAAAKKALADLARGLANAIIQALILKSIQTGFGSFGGGGGNVGVGAGAGGGAGIGFGAQAEGGVLGYARGGFLGFRTTPGIIQMGTTATADDVPFWGSKGEGIVKASAVDYYGPSMIHALNRFSIPREIFHHHHVMPTLRFADGGVVGQLAREQAANGAPGGHAPPQQMIINNVLSFGEDEGERIGSLSSMREATFAHMESDPDRVARVLRGRIRG